MRNITISINWIDPIAPVEILDDETRAAWPRYEVTITIDGEQYVTAGWVVCGHVGERNLTDGMLYADQSPGDWDWEHMDSHFCGLPRLDTDLPDGLDIDDLPPDETPQFRLVAGANLENDYAPVVLPQDIDPYDLIDEIRDAVGQAAEQLMPPKKD